MQLNETVSFFQNMTFFLTFSKAIKDILVPPPSWGYVPDPPAISENPRNRNTLFKYTLGMFL